MAGQYSRDLEVDGGNLLDLVFTFRSAGGTSNPDLIRDGRPYTPGVAVTHAGSTGEYLVTLPKVGGGWPQQVVGCVCQLAFVDMTAMVAGAGLQVGYKASSYSAAAGTFRIMTMLDDGTPAAQDLADNVEVHVHLRVQKSNVLKQP